MSVGKHMPRLRTHGGADHFKGHAMGGYGGSLRQSPSAARTVSSAKDGPRRPRQRNPEAWLKGERSRRTWLSRQSHHRSLWDTDRVHQRLRNMSVDCDCAGVAAGSGQGSGPGNLGSTDILAVDQAPSTWCINCLKLSFNDLKERIETRQGLPSAQYMKDPSMGYRNIKWSRFDMEYGRLANRGSRTARITG